MKKILYLILLMVSKIAFGQDPAPSNVVQLTTNTPYYQTTTGLHWNYNGTTYLWYKELGVKDSTYYITPWYASQHFAPIGSGVTSVFGRTGAVTAQTGDYSAFYPLLNGTGATGTWGISISGNSGTVTNGVYTTTFNALGDARYPLLSGSYVNPSWITSLAWSKITATPTTLAGYGITDGISLTYFNANIGTATAASIALKELLSNKTATQSSSATTYPNWLGVTNYVSGIGSAYAPYSTQYYTKQFDISPPEITPDTLIESLYNAFPIMGQFKSGIFYMIYKHQPGHPDPGQIEIRKSVDGKTWGSPVIIVPDGPTERIGGVTAGITPTGRLIIGYARFPSGVYVDTRYIYSDDEGATWSTSAPVAIETPYGEIIPIGNGKLLMPGYDETNLTPGNAQYAISSDNGATWTAHTITDAVIYSNETSFAYLGGGTIIALARTQYVFGFNLYISYDNGVTWTTPTNHLLVPNANYMVSPWLSTYLSPSGRRMVTVFYANRGTFKIIAMTGSAQDIINNGTNGFNATTYTEVANITNSSGLLGGGYPSVVHPNNSEYALGAFYADITSSNTTMHLFTYPSNGAQPIIIGDVNVDGNVNISGNFNVNGVGVVKSGSITWPGTIFTSPTAGVVTAGALGFSPALATQAINTILAGPGSGGSAAPTFRSLVVADIPVLNQAQSANYVLAGPATGSGAALPTFRVLVNGDIPALNYAAPNQAFFFGTTSIPINRASATLNVTGIGTMAFVGTNNFLNNTTVTTNGKYINIQNGAGNQIVMGMSGIVGNEVLNSGTPYSLAVGTGGATNLEFGVNNAIYTRLNGSTHNWLFGQLTTDNGTTNNIQTNTSISAVLPTYSSGTILLTGYNSTNKQFETTTAVPSGTTLGGATGLPLSTGVSGILATSNGGWGISSFTSGAIYYASSSASMVPSILTATGSTAAVAGPFNLKNYTVATLPAGTRGDIAYVTDALAPSFLTTVVGGGGVVTPVFYNGSSWVAQ